MHYVFLDEIQKVDDIQNPDVNNKDSKIGFVDVLLEIMKIRNVDLYVTGSNSHMLPFSMFSHIFLALSFTCSAVSFD